MSRMKVGLSGLCFAEQTKDDPTGSTYGPVTQIPGVATLGTKVAASADTFYADNGAYDVSTALGEITLDVEVADPTNEIVAKLLGHKIVKGVVIDGGSDTPIPVAVGFIGLRSDGKKRYVWLLKGVFQEPDDDYKTKGAKSDPQAVKLTAKFMVRVSDGNWRMRVDEDASGIEPTTIANWFKPETIAVVKA